MCAGQGWSNLGSVLIWILALTCLLTCLFPARSFGDDRRDNGKIQLQAFQRGSFHFQGKRFVASAGFPSMQVIYGSSVVGGILVQRGSVSDYDDDLSPKHPCLGSFVLENSGTARFDIADRGANGHMINGRFAGEDCLPDLPYLTHLFAHARSFSGGTEFSGDAVDIDSRKDEYAHRWHLPHVFHFNFECDLRPVFIVSEGTSQGSPYGNPRALGVDERLHVVLGSLGLTLDNFQSATGDPDAPNGYQNQRPVCPHWLEYFLAPRNPLRLAIGSILFFLGAWPGRRADIFRPFSASPSRFLRLLGKVLTIILIGLGIIFLFWDRLKENAEKQRKDQTSLHSGTIVLQKYLDNLYCCSTVIDMANVLNSDKQTAIIAALAEGSSIRSIERITGVHRDTIMRLGVKVGQGCTVLLDEKMRNLPCRLLQFDEVWGFIGKKERHVRPDDDPQYGDVWTFCAIDAETKLVPSFKCGKRDLATAKVFVADVQSRMTNRVQISADALRAYVDAIEQTFGADVDFGQIVKTYEHDESQNAERKYSAAKFVSVEKRSVTGSPDMDLVSTSYIERLNATTRLHMRRLTRLTLAFSKKLENFEAAVGLHFAYYNFVKRHNSLRCTPAMAAGVERDFWSVDDLVKVVA